MTPYWKRAFCFSCSWVRYSFSWIRRRPCWPGGNGRSSKFLSPPTRSTLSRRDFLVMGPVYRAMCLSDLLLAQTRRRLGGRTPLCGEGVTSLIAPTSRPVAVSERIAVSRPDPGPLTNTSTRFMPCSMARRPAASAAICAAYGVDLRDPLKPTVPADAQAITAPLGSVIEMTVLLNVLLM